MELPLRVDWGGKAHLDVCYCGVVRTCSNFCSAVPFSALYREGGRAKGT